MPIDARSVPSCTRAALRSSLRKLENHYTGIFTSILKALYLVALDMVALADDAEVV